MTESSTAAGAAPAQMPPFESLLKSRAVEDPVNLWFNRPMAYLFVRLVYRTRITPNQITFMAMVVGVATFPLFLIGTPEAMLAAGILLWTSAILDGADGILARAKRLHSDIGRALDGLVDTVVVGFSATGAFYHLWANDPDPMWFLWMGIAAVTAFFQAWLYDFYKESYMKMTDPSWDGVPERIEDIERWWAETKASNKPWYVKWATKSYLDLVSNQAKWVAFFTPAATRRHKTFRVTEESCAIYRRRHRWLIQLWSLISLAPHAYLFSIAAMFDALPYYIFFRVVPANALMLVLLVWQRIASRRTLADLERAGLAPEPWTPPAAAAA